MFEFDRLPASTGWFGVLVLSVAASLVMTGCGGNGEGKEGAAAASAAASGAHGEGASQPGGPMLNLETFIVNLSDAGGGRYVKCTFKLELASKETLESIQAEESMIPKIRDRILSLLSSRTGDSLMCPQGKDLLKREVVARLQPLMKKGKIQEVYITDMLVQ